ncbi:MAG: glycosyltransferase family 2 protein [Clostridiaceae bacterium]|nr:glycosyltransferase family 2 protein [Clostridiaceae bacterium]
MYISAIIPAYNEEKTVGKIIETLKNVNIINEIIVVNDGSEDKTAQIAREHKVTVIKLAKNMGKGAAIKTGLEASKGVILLFLDADLIGLKEFHIKKLLEPVIKDECDMAIGIFSKGRASTDLAQILTPHLSGQRAVKRTIIEKIEKIELTGYGIEVALTRYAKKNNIRVKEIKLDNLTHITKEEKFGVAVGLKKRIIMYWQIFKGLKLAKRY